MPLAEYRTLWNRALPYLGVRRNDEHTRYCVAFAATLADLAGAERRLVLPAMILHDTGWSTVPEDKILESFGPRTRYPELRRQHELEGARIAREILTDLAFSDSDVETITAIIDGHDTRPDPLSTEDAVVKDSDKLWRYTPFGLATVREWFGHTIEQQLALLEDWRTNRLYTGPARHIAAGLLAALRAEYVR